MKTNTGSWVCMPNNGGRWTQKGGLARLVVWDGFWFRWRRIELEFPGAAL